MSENIAFMFVIVLAILAIGIILLTVALLGLRKKSADNNTADILEQNKKLFEEIEKKLSILATHFSMLSQSVLEQSSLSRTENAALLKGNREELSNSLEEIRKTLETKLAEIQTNNNQKLDEMRKTVDEKLSETISKRFNESFNLISERLEQVQKGLGEMTILASDVGGLKKVLSNVKTRGNLGEIQLGAILEQLLSREQYDEQYAVKPGAERVDYVVKLPGNTDDGTPLYLPVDAKFPVEDFQRLQEAYETGLDIDGASRKFEDAVKKNGKSISEKYINPPVTTDFAIMFVPTEGLYAEILRRTGLFETLQRDYKISVVGPSNLAAFLSSLQMGFRTLAIEKRSGEVWNLLGAVKNEFGKFGDVLESAVQNLDAARNKFEKMGTRSRAIERKLRTVEILPDEQTVALIGDAIDVPPESPEDEET